MGKRETADFRFDIGRWALNTKTGEMSKVLDTCIWAMRDHPSPGNAEEANEYMKKLTQHSKSPRGIYVESGYIWPPGEYELLGPDPGKKKPPEEQVDAYRFYHKVLASPAGVGKDQVQRAIKSLEARWDFSEVEV